MAKLRTFSHRGSGVDRTPRGAGRGLPIKSRDIDSVREVGSLNPTSENDFGKFEPRAERAQLSGEKAMTKIPTSADERKLLRLIAVVNRSGLPLDVTSAAGRYVASMDQDCVRDLRGVQFERDIRLAMMNATSDPLRETPDDRTLVDEGDAMGMLTHVAVAELVSQLGPDQAAEALLRISGDVRRYGASDLRETVLNLVDEAVHDLS